MDDCWLILGDDVYNVTSYLRSHPGGEIIMEGAGIDATDLFYKNHSYVDYEKILKDCYIGGY